MDIPSLRYALTLAEELHFGRAARRHFITEQAFGRRIRKLERQLELQLFDRTSRRVTLTAAGERFVPLARQAVDRIDQLAAAAHEDGPTPDPTVLRVGVLGFGLAERWPLVLDLLRQQLPDVALAYVEVDWDSQYDLVRSGDLDVAVVHDIGPVDGLTFDRVLDTGRFVVVPAGSPLADAEHLSEADVCDQQWIRPVGRHPGLADWAGPAGSVGATSTLVRTPSSVPAAVAATGQFGIHGEPARRFFPHPGVRYVPMDGNPAIVSVASRADDRSPAVRAFRRAARAGADERVGGPVAADRNPFGT